MKKMFLILAVALFIATAPVKAQSAPPDPPKLEAPQPSAPKLPADVREKIRTHQAELQSIYLQEYKLRDQYNDAMKKLEEQAKMVAHDYEAAITLATKDIDAKKWLFNRGTLDFDAAPPAKQEAKK